MAKSNKPDELLPTRASLLERLKNLDDSKSWQEFFDTYWDLIYGVAIKSGLSPADAEDVVQETVIHAARHIGEFKYDPTLSFKAWLLHATRWRIIDQIRKRSPVAISSSHNRDDTTRTKTVERIPAPTGYDLDAKWDSEWREHIQQKALDRIRNSVNPKHYQIFDAHVLRAWPVEKVILTLHVSEDQVYKVKSRLMQLLKKEVSRLERIAV